MSSQKFLPPAKTKKREDQERPQTGFFLIEKREDLRYSIELPFNYSLADTEETRGGILSDASEAGLLVYLHRRVDIGTLLNIEILFARGFQLAGIKGLAKVVWSDLAAKESFGEYRYGLQFQSFQEGDIDKLRFLLRRAKRSLGQYD